MQTRTFLQLIYRTLCHSGVLSNFVTNRNELQDATRYAHSASLSGTLYHNIVQFMTSQTDTKWSHFSLQRYEIDPLVHLSGTKPSAMKNVFQMCLLFVVKKSYLTIQVFVSASHRQYLEKCLEDEYRLNSQKDFFREMSTQNIQCVPLIFVSYRQLNHSISNFVCEIHPEYPVCSTHFHVLPTTES